jgi:hypothetical protein
VLPIDKNPVPVVPAGKYNDDNPGPVRTETAVDDLDVPAEFVAVIVIL